jgi:hypothetical protein
MLPAVQRSMIDGTLLELRSEEWPLDLVDVYCICYLGKQTGYGASVLIGLCKFCPIHSVTLFLSINERTGLARLCFLGDGNSFSRI